MGGFLHDVQYPTHSGNRMIRWTDLGTRPCIRAVQAREGSKNSGKGRAVRDVVVASLMAHCEPRRGRVRRAHTATRLRLVSARPCCVGGIAWQRIRARACVCAAERCAAGTCITLPAPVTVSTSKNMPSASRRHAKNRFSAQLPRDEGLFFLRCALLLDECRRQECSGTWCAARLRGTAGQALPLESAGEHAIPRANERAHPRRRCT